MSSVNFIEFRLENKIPASVSKSNMENLPGGIKDVNLLLVQGGQEGRENKKGLRQCAMLQDLGEGDYCYDCDCYGGKTL